MLLLENKTAVDIINDKAYDYSFPLHGELIQKYIQLPKEIAYHVCSNTGLDRLIQLQEKHYPICVFQNHDAKSVYDIVTGIVELTSCVVKLEGKLLLAHNRDVFTLRDEKGRRWIDLEELYDDKRFFKKSQVNALKRLMDSVAKIKHAAQGKHNAEAYFFEKISQLIKNKAESLVQILYTGCKYNPEETDYDECVMTKFKIQSICCVKYEGVEFIQQKSINKKLPVYYLPVNDGDVADNIWSEKPALIKKQKKNNEKEIVAFLNNRDIKDVYKI